MKHSVKKRAFWILFMPSWLILTCTLLTPICWYIISGKDWISPENIYNDLEK
jgi:hypothetical protein